VALMTMEFCNAESKNPKASRQKFKNVQFWVSDLIKNYQEENLPQNDWIASVGKTALKKNLVNICILLLMVNSLSKMCKGVFEDAFEYR
jgi:hypothetical protein